MCYSLHFMLFFQGPEWVASGGTDGTLPFGKLCMTSSDRGSREIQILKSIAMNLSIKVDDSVNMDDDADELELLLTVKAELGALKLKQNHLQKMFEEGNDGGTTGLKIFEKMAKDLHSAKVNDEINTTMARIAQLPSMHGIVTVN